MNLPRTDISPESDVFARFSEYYSRREQEELSLRDYLLGCREDPGFYESAAERMLAAIGEPEVVDTSTDPCSAPGSLDTSLGDYPLASCSDASYDADSREGRGRTVRLLSGALLGRFFFGLGVWSQPLSASALLMRSLMPLIYIRCAGRHPK